MKKDIKDVELFLFDLDGTVYIGDKEIDGAFNAINTLRAMGKRICFFTNNSSRMHTDYISRLNNLGLRVYSDEIYTSGQVTCEYILDKYRGKRVYLLGNERLKSEFDLYGIEVVEFDPLFAKLVENDAKTEIVLIEDRFVGGQLLARMANGDLGDGFHVAVKTHLGRGRSRVDN